MDFLSVIFSVNKVALVFFILTFGFVIYELGMYLRERQPAKTPYVPQFDPNSHASNMTIPVVVPVQNLSTSLPTKKKRPLLLLIATFILIVLGGLTLFYTPTSKKIPKPQPTRTLVVTPAPTIFQAAIPTSIPTPTHTADSEPDTKEVSIIPTERPIPTEYPTSTPTTVVVTNTVEELPAAGSYQYLLLLTVAASTVVVASFLF